MEFDILNDMLYSTVSNLFPNKAQHLSFFIKEEDQFKADIPRSSSRKEDLHHSSNSKEIRDFNNPILYENWKNKEAKRRLEEAIKRLNLDESRIKSKSLSAFPSDFLMSEKAKVKNELKKYDNEFTDLFNRPPNRAEKEVMRPIYLYYKNLKAALDAKGKQGQQSNQTTNANQVHNSNTVVNDKNQVVVTNNYVNAKSSGQNRDASASSSNPTSNSSNLQTNPSAAQKIRNPNVINNNNAAIQNSNELNAPQMANNLNFPSFNQTNHNHNAVNSAFKSNTTSNFNSNESNKLISKDNQDKNNYLKENQISSSNTNYYGFQNNSFSNNRDIKDRKGEMRIGKEEKGSKSKVESDQELDAILLGNPSQKEKRSNSHSHTQSQKDKKYSKTELLQMEKEYDAIKKEQIELKQKLHNYQKEFYQQHNRKVKYYKDIIGMENEYQAYKENKQRLRQILDVLEKYRNANG